MVDVGGRKYPQSVVLGGGGVVELASARVFGLNETGVAAAGVARVNDAAAEQEAEHLHLAQQRGV